MPSASWRPTASLAVAVQHEIDHLNGVLFVDHISRLKRERVLKKFAKAARLAAEEGRAYDPRSEEREPQRGPKTAASARIDGLTAASCASSFWGPRILRSRP